MSMYDEICTELQKNLPKRFKFYKVDGQFLFPLHKTVGFIAYIMCPVNNYDVYIIPLEFNLKTFDIEEEPIGVIIKNIVDKEVRRKRYYLRPRTIFDGYDLGRMFK